MSDQTQSQFMHYRKAAPLLGLTETALYNGIRQGVYPSMRVGGPHGRHYVSVAAVQTRIDQLMQANIKNVETEQDSFLHPRFRKIGG